MKETDIEIQALIERYKHLEKFVSERLHNIFADSGLMIHVTHRIKTPDSIKGKLDRKPNEYSSIYEIYDILGFRVICYMSTDVDLAAKLIADKFRVDWNRSKDKRKIIDARSFGYLALHYVCALPENESELSDLWFEIQIKTILQHCWAEIEHDLGYKSEFEVPRDIRRSFSKAASLLETADDIFVYIRKSLNEYRIKIKQDIENDKLDELFFDKITLAEFTSNNIAYRNLLNEIAAVTNARILEGNSESQLPLINFLEIRSFRDMVNLINEEHDLALKLARELLQDSEIDELSSTAAYHFLFRARLIRGSYSKEKIREFFMLTMKNEKLIESNTNKIIDMRKKFFGLPESNS